MTRNRFAIIAVAIASALAILGFLLRGVSERSIQNRMAQELTTILKADVNALLIWLDDRKENASYFASDARVASAIQRLSEWSERGASSVTLRLSTEAVTLSQLLDPVVRAFPPQTLAPGGKRTDPSAIAMARGRSISPRALPPRRRLPSVIR